MEPGLAERGDVRDGLGARTRGSWPEVFAILLTPGQEQLMLVLQAIFESGIRKVELTMTIEMPSTQSPPHSCQRSSSPRLAARRFRASAEFLGWSWGPMTGAQMPGPLGNGSCWMMRSRSCCGSEVRLAPVANCE
jgi:hypothetical protein